MKPRGFSAGAALLVLSLGCSGPKGEVTGCTISGEAIDAGSLNPQNQCQVCSPLTNPGGWSNSPSGSSCGPGGSICAGGTCQEGCYISSVFFPTGAANPANGCLSCQPAVSTTGWSPFSGAAPDGTCPMLGVCYQGHCQPGCAIGTTAVPAGAANPENFCQSCQPDQGTSFWTSKAPGATCADGGAVCVNGTCTAGCEIGGVLYNPGNPSPANLCQTCQPNFSVSAFTPATGLAPGGDCGNGAYCYQGQCSSGCSILGTSYAPGTPDPASSCLGCVPGISATNWSNLDPGTPCGSGGVCSGGVCLFGCSIGTTIYPPGAEDPADVCHSCQPAVSTTDWSPLTGIPLNGCTSGQVCLDGGCVVGCYISDGFQRTAFHAPGQRKPGDGSLCCAPSNDSATWSSAFATVPGLNVSLAPYSYSYYGVPLGVAADFNGDHRADLAFLSWTTDTSGTISSPIVLYLSDSDGGQESAQAGSLPYASSLAAGDLDGDGKPDLVASDTLGHVYVLMNLGNGSFGSATTYASNVPFYDAGVSDGGLIPYYQLTGGGNVSLADVNRDGVLDVLIAGGSFGANFSVLLGIGDGGLAPGVAVSSPGTVSSYVVETADFNGDGAPDVLLLGDTAISSGVGDPYLYVSSYSQALYLLLNDGKGNFTNPISIGLSSLAYGLATGDFNGDGKSDVALSVSYSSGLQILQGLGNGTFAPAATYSPDNYADQLLVGDFNADGFPDLVLNGYGDPPTLFLNLGDGTFSAGSSLNGLPLGFSSGVAADLNGDGLDDLAIEDDTGTLSIWLNNCR